MRGEGLEYSLFGEREHTWQPYPVGGCGIVQCSHCRIVADSAASVQALPGECPREAPTLPHILAMRPTPYGKPRAACLCCELPPFDAFDWQCGNGKNYPTSKNRT